MSKIIHRKGNENYTNYRNVSSLLNLSPQDKSIQNIAENREEGNENYKLKQKSSSEQDFIQ